MNLNQVEPLKTSLLQLIRSPYDASYGIYGYRRITLDLKELGEGVVLIVY